MSSLAKTKSVDAPLTRPLDLGMLRQWWPFTASLGRRMRIHHAWLCQI